MADGLPTFREDDRTNASDQMLPLSDAGLRNSIVNQGGNPNKTLLGSRENQSDQVPLSVGAAHQEPALDAR